MASYTIIGDIRSIKNTEVVSDKFSKREFVITEVSERYPQSIPIIFVNDKCSSLDGYKVGERVQVSFNVRGNEWKDKIYIEFNAWKIERHATEGSTPAMQQNSNFDKEPAGNAKDEDDCLPF